MLDKNLALEIVKNSGGMISIKEAANYTGVSEPTIRRMLETGKLHFAKLGGCVRIPKAELIDIIASNLTGGWER